MEVGYGMMGLAVLSWFCCALVGGIAYSTKGGTVSRGWVIMAIGFGVLGLGCAGQGLGLGSGFNMSGKLAGALGFILIAVGLSLHKKALR